MCVYVCMYTLNRFDASFEQKALFGAAPKNDVQSTALSKILPFRFPSRTCSYPIGIWEHVQCKDIMYANVTIHNQEGIEYKSEAPRTQTLADDSTQALKPCTFA